MSLVYPNCISRLSLILSVHVIPADDAVIHDGAGKILGNGFVVDHILRGETMADVLGRSQHSVSAVVLPQEHMQLRCAHQIKAGPMLAQC